MTLYAAERYADAVTAFSEAVDLLPREPIFRLNRAAALLALRTVQAYTCAARDLRLLTGGWRVGVLALQPQPEPHAALTVGTGLAAQRWKAWERGCRAAMAIGAVEEACQLVEQASHHRLEQMDAAAAARPAWTAMKAALRRTVKALDAAARVTRDPDAFLAAMEEARTAIDTVVPVTWWAAAARVTLAGKRMTGPALSAFVARFTDVVEQGQDALLKGDPTTRVRYRDWRRVDQAAMLDMRRMQLQALYDAMEFERMASFDVTSWSLPKPLPEECRDTAGVALRGAGPVVPVLPKAVLTLLYPTEYADPEALLKEVRLLQDTGTTLGRLKRSAKEAHVASDYAKAIRLYTQALDMTFTHERYRAVMHWNRAGSRRALAATLKADSPSALQGYRDAVADCTDAIRFDPAYLAAYLRRGQSRLSLSLYTAARDDFQHVLASPTDDAKLQRDAERFSQQTDAALDAAVAREDAAAKRGTHYDALGVTPGATAAQVRKAYRDRVIHAHPDKVGDGVEPVLANARFHRVQVAYEVLADPVARRTYDLTLARPAYASATAGWADRPPTTHNWAYYGRQRPPSYS